MEQKVYFPINCSLSPITITTNYGEPYPNQKFFSLREQRILFDIASLIRSYESNYSSFKQNYPNLPQNLSSITDRILLLEFIVNTNPQKLNFARSKILVDRNKLIDKSNFKYISFHPGVDINYGSGNQDLGLPVYAVTDGVVINASRHFCSASCDCSGFVAVEHRCQNKIFYALYGHVVPEVTIGKKVKAGERIASIGEYKCNSTSHLHLEITLKNIYSNFPKNYPRNMYKDKGLNLAYIAAILYDILNTTTSSTQYCIDYKYYINSFMDPNESWNFFGKNNPYTQATSDEVFYGGSYAKYYGYIEPLNFLRSFGQNKIYSPVTQSLCPSFNTRRSLTPMKICFAVQ